jgi:hypothetical protein
MSRTRASARTGPAVRTRRRRPNVGCVPDSYPGTFTPLRDCREEAEGREGSLRQISHPTAHHGNGGARCRRRCSLWRCSSGSPPTPWRLLVRTAIIHITRAIVAIRAEIIARRTTIRRATRIRGLGRYRVHRPVLRIRLLERRRLLRPATSVWSRFTTRRGRSRTAERSVRRRRIMTAPSTCSSA